MIKIGHGQSHITNDCVSWLMRLLCGCYNLALLMATCLVLFYVAHPSCFLYLLLFSSLVFLNQLSPFLSVSISMLSSSSNFSSFSACGQSSSFFFSVHLHFSCFMIFSISLFLTTLSHLNGTVFSRQLY